MLTLARPYSLEDNEMRVGIGALSLLEDADVFLGMRNIFLLRNAKQRAHLWYITAVMVQLIFSVVVKVCFCFMDLL